MFLKSQFIIIKVWKPAKMSSNGPLDNKNAIDTYVTYIIPLRMSQIFITGTQYLTTANESRGLIGLMASRDVVHGLLLQGRSITSEDLAAQSC